MFGRKDKKSSQIDTGSIKMDFELRRMLGLGGISPPSSPFKPGDPNMPPLPKSVMDVISIKKPNS